MKTREEKINFIKDYVAVKGMVMFSEVGGKEDVTFNELSGEFEITVNDAILEEQLNTMTMEEVELLCLEPVVEKEVTWNYLSDEYLNDIISIIKK
jgi:hypothetical protein